MGCAQPDDYTTPSSLATNFAQMAGNTFSDGDIWINALPEGTKCDSRGDRIEKCHADGVGFRKSGVCSLKL